MNSTTRLLELFLVVISATCAVYAQSGDAKQPEKTKPAATTAKAKDPDADRIARQRRAQARSLLVALSVDARTFRDQPLRARSLARIADTLWAVDPEQARSMFRKAWEAAEVADQESDRKLQEEYEQRKAKTGSGAFAFSSPPNLRREVLRLVSRHDTTLGEEFLEKLKIQQKEAAQNPLRSSDADSQRLGVARELLTEGDPERALQFAEPIFGRVTMENIDFLSYVREANPALADARYAAMLTQQAMNPQADANTVSLLSSYVFTPHLMITFTGNGTSSSQATDKIQPAEVSPELRAAFLNTAASILLRPIPAPGQDQGRAGIEGRYLVTKRLLPFFEQFGSPEQAQSMQTQLDTLAAAVPDGTRNRDDEWMRRGVKPEVRAEDREQQLLDRIDRAKTSAERDSLYIQLANSSFGAPDLRAREFISKIEDPELRQQAGAYVDGTLVVQLVEKKKIDLLLELVAKGDLTHVLKAWALASAAKELAKTDRQRAMDIIEDAGNEARRIDTSDADRPKALLAVANTLNEIDPPRAWDATFDAVKAANSAEGFTGEDGIIVLKFSSKSQSSVSDHTVADFDVAGIFRTLADKDYDRAVELAQGFQAEGPRAVATIAIARAVLDPKKPAATAAKKPAAN